MSELTKKFHALREGTTAIATPVVQHIETAITALKRTQATADSTVKSQIAAIVAHMEVLKNYAASPATTMLPDLATGTPTNVSDHVEEMVDVMADPMTDGSNFAATGIPDGSVAAGSAPERDLDFEMPPSPGPDIDGLSKSASASASASVIRVRVH